jgi:hypothetical protein
MHLSLIKLIKIEKYKACLLLCIKNLHAIFEGCGGKVQPKEEVKLFRLCALYTEDDLFCR